ncbi:hypothetical protein BST81_19585 [Leptolyngbya sp. 'hensonii']|uniref:hypothetical protein n=1 Tax=Leptolyngbya sp. 'hensonii' TaxID=1922337 RepID=UPI00094F50D3|nr:hypothetical protein [Leptolyngbya sp. 'hensonii']OLP16642.1 hypothetical protein BST81_19585 [Leptolyngbya sp. 'hensonii']
MGHQVHTPKKSPGIAIAPPIQGKLSSRPVTVPLQGKPLQKAVRQQKPLSLQAQIDRATRFGHNLNQVQIYPSAPAAIQRRPISRSNAHIYVQRQVVEEERKRDEESEQRQFKSDQQPIQGFFIGMILGAILPKILKLLFPDSGGGGGGGGGGVDSGGGGGGGGGGGPGGTSR